MSLHPLAFEIPESPIPRHIQILLDETAEPINDWQSAPGQHPFVPADYVVLWDGLRRLRPMMTAAKPVFLEWGSGMGVVTMLAAALGWEAHGIELQAGLVAESRGWAKRFGLPAHFHAGSFFPQDPEGAAELAALCRRADVIYVYPWPDQELRTFDLFDRLARSGTYFLNYHSFEDLRLYRKD